MLCIISTGIFLLVSDKQMCEIQNQSVDSYCTDQGIVKHTEIALEITI